MYINAGERAAPLRAVGGGVCAHAWNLPLRSILEVFPKILVFSHSTHARYTAVKDQATRQFAAYDELFAVKEQKLAALQASVDACAALLQPRQKPTSGWLATLRHPFLKIGNFALAASKLTQTSEPESPSVRKPLSGRENAVLSQSTADNRYAEFVKNARLLAVI